jgi:hypothetical protein
MVDRTIPWGDPANAAYFTGEGGSDPPDGNFVVAETAAGTKLMEWDATASAWQVRGDVNASGQSLTVGSVDANSVSTDRATIGSTHRYVNDDSQLDSELTAATDGDRIILGDANFSKNRTISKELLFTGSGTGVEGGTDLSGAEWTFDSTARLINIGVADKNTVLTFNDIFSGVYNSRLGGGTTVIVDAGKFIYANNFVGEVIFQSGVSNGIVDGCVNTAVTDNGTNIVGDIA